MDVTNQVTDNITEDVTEQGAADATQPPAIDLKRKRFVDPLVYLREFASQKKHVSYEDDWLDFAGHKIHRSAKCGLVLQRGSPLIDIGSVWYMLHETSADRSYTQASTRNKGFVYISVVVRGDLCDFLLGRRDTCPGLVEEVYEGRKRPKERPPQPSTKQPLRATDAAGDQSFASEITYEEASRRLRSVQDLDVIIRRPGKMVPNADLILKIAQEEWQNWTRGAKTQNLSGAKSAKGMSLKIELEKILEDDENYHPIILVPCNKNAPINMLNVGSLLQDGIFEKPDKERLMFFESTRQEYVHVMRNIGGKFWTFEVRDTTKTFTKAQWLRTVLCISDGTEWQFKGWPFENIVDLFTSIRGVYFAEPGKPLQTNVASWPCSKITLPIATAQHRYAALRDQIFTELEDFLNSSRTKKFVNTSGLDGLRTKIDYCKQIL